MYSRGSQQPWIWRQMDIVIKISPAENLPPWSAEGQTTPPITVHPPRPRLTVKPALTRFALKLIRHSAPAAPTILPSEIPSSPLELLLPWEQLTFTANLRWEP